MKNQLLSFYRSVNWWTMGHYLVITLFSLILDITVTAIHITSGKTFIINDKVDILLYIAYIFSVLMISLYVSRRLDKSILYKFGIGYAVYCCLSYFLLLTRNLNNGDFQPFNLIKNNFFETNALITVGLILTLAFGIQYYLQHKTNKIVSYLTYVLEDYKGNDFLYYLLGLVIANNSQVLKIVSSSLEIYDSKSVDFYISLLTQSAWILLLATALVYITYKAIMSLKNNKADGYLVVGSSLLLAVVFNYTLQSAVKEHLELLERYIFPGGTMYQLLVLTLFFVGVYLLINRYIPATLVIIILGTLVSIANVIKFSMRSEPLLITDFTWLSELNLLFSFVDIKVILAILLVLLLPFAIYWFTRKRYFLGTIIGSVKQRLVWLGLILALFSGIFVTFKTEKDSKIASGIPILSTVNNWYNIDWMGFGANARYKSLMYVWTKQLTTSVMEKPEHYSQESIKKLVTKYSNLANDINKTRSNHISDQTVIYILSESLSNPNHIKGVGTSVNVLENIDTIKSQTTSGLMKSDGYGGGTANMEFQSLTGLPYYNFKSSVSTLYTEVVPKMSVFPAISDMFESSNRLVLHPSGASNYNRYNVYKELGFNKLIFSTGSKDKFKDVEKVGVSVSDETVYKNVLDNLDTNQSQFFSVITMQNHAPWSVRSPEEVIASGDQFSKEENGNLTEYARLLTYTDKATKSFLEQLSTIDKDITVVFYGDHLPGLYPESIFKNNPEVKYQTDYFIWSNHGNNKIEHPLVNSSDLTAELFEHTNSKVSPYYALLTNVLENASVDKKKLTSEQQAIANDLKLVQYDITIGKGYLKNYQSFFEIAK